MNVGQHLSQVPPADLYVTVLGQLAPPELPLNDALEPGPLQIVRPTQSSGVGRSGRRRWKTRRGTRTTPLYSPISTPNSTACRSAFHRAPSGNEKNIGASCGAPMMFSKGSASRAQQGRSAALGLRTLSHVWPGAPKRKHFASLTPSRNRSTRRRLLGPITTQMPMASGVGAALADARL